MRRLRYDKPKTSNSLLLTFFFICNLHLAPAKPTYNVKSSTSRNEKSTTVATTNEIEVSVIEAQKEGEVRNDKNQEDSNENEFQQMIKQVMEYFTVRHGIVQALMIVALIQIVLLITGSSCLLYIYLCGTKLGRNFRAHEPSKLEKIGRVLITIGTVVSLALTGPMLCLAAATHFYAGGVIEKSMCQAIRSDDPQAVDNLLNVASSNSSDNILRDILPQCLINVINSVDPKLFDERMTVKSFLDAAKNDQTLNSWLQIHDTAIAEEIKSLAMLNLTGKVEINSGKMKEYNDNFTQVLETRKVLQELANEPNVRSVSWVYGKLKQCRSCMSNQAHSNDLLYQNLTIEYLEKLYAAVNEWNNSLVIFDRSQGDQRDFLRLVNNFDQYFNVTISLFKDQFSYMVSKIVDNVAEGITANVGKMGAIYDLYNDLVIKEVCGSFIGSLNAIWFFLGIYLIFSTISAFLAIITISALKAMR